MRSLEDAIQIAGVHDLAEAETIIEAGATFVGLPLPLRLPDGREDLTEASAARLCRAIADRADPVLITYQAAAIAAFADELGSARSLRRRNIPAAQAPSSTAPSPRSRWRHCAGLGRAWV